jgi:hypothetical protein
MQEERGFRVQAMGLCFLNKKWVENNFETNQQNQQATT